MPLTPRQYRGGPASAREPLVSGGPDAPAPASSSVAVAAGGARRLVALPGEQRRMVDDGAQRAALGGAANLLAAGQRMVTGERRPRAEAVTLSQMFKHATPKERVIVFFSALAACFTGLQYPTLAFLMQTLFMSIFQPVRETRQVDVRNAALMFLAAGALAFCFTLFSFVGFARVADSISAKLRRNFFEKLLEKNVGWYDFENTEDMATRLTEDTYIFRQGIGDKLATFISAVVMTPAGFAVAFRTDWRLMLMMLLPIPFMTGAFTTAMKKMQKSHLQQKEFYAQAGNIAKTAIGAVRTVAAFGGYQREVLKYEEMLILAEENGVRAGTTAGVAMGFNALVVYLTFAFGFWVGALLIIHDYHEECWVENPPFGDCFNGGRMLATLFAVLYGGIGISQADTTMATINSGKEAAARIYQIIDEPIPFMVDDPNTRKPERVEGAIEFAMVTFAYPARPDVFALEDLTFTVPKGTAAAFVGPAGAGKSTVVALLQRFYDPKSGVIRLDGDDIRDLNLKWLRSHMALVQQEPVLFSGSIFDNIKCGLEGSGDRDAEQAAKQANAHYFIDGFPQRYRTEVSTYNLSGGQKQRIAIARAIIRQPKILLLDEATSALDTECERLVQKALDDLMAQKTRTTIVIAHRVATMKDVNRIFYIESGRLVEQGTHEELIALEGSYAKMAKEQELMAMEDRPDAIRKHSRSGLSGLSFGETHFRSASFGNSRNTSFGASDSPGRPGDPRRNARGASRGGRGISRGNSGGLLPEPMDEFEESDSDDDMMPEEDDFDVEVPTKELWRMQKDQVQWIALAFACTVPIAVASPLLGLLFSTSTSTLSRPPVQWVDGVDGVDGRWVRQFEADKLRDEANNNCWLYVALAVVVFFTQMGQLMGFRRASEALTRALRLETFSRMLRQDMSWFDARTIGGSPLALADRLAVETTFIRAFTGESTAGYLQMFITIVTGLSIALIASWQLTLASAIFVPFLMAGSAAMIKFMRRRNDTRAGPLVMEAMRHIKCVAAYGLEGRMLSRYGDLLKVEAENDRNQSTTTGLSAAYNAFMTFAMFAIVVYIGNIFIDHGWLQAAEVFRVIFPILFAIQGMARAQQWLTDRVRAKMALNRIFNTINHESIIKVDADGETPYPLPGAIHFSHVRFAYPTRPEVKVFVDLDLKVEAGSTVAFVGESGSGKSTVLALLQRFYDPVGGSIRIDDKELRRLNLKWFRERMALVEQEPVLFAGSIKDNIRYGLELRVSDPDIVKASKCSGAHALIMRQNAEGHLVFPQEYETVLGEHGTQISGGERQCIAIARAIVRDPQILLLDEATSALDTEMEREVQEKLEAWCREKRRTTIVIAHRLSTVVNADKICVIADGRIFESGTHDELMAKADGRYKRIANRQSSARPSISGAAFSAAKP